MNTQKVKLLIRMVNDLCTCKTMNDLTFYFRFAVVKILLQPVSYQ